MALETVGDYVDNARVLLQDTVAPYRYSDDELVEALNFGVAEVIRVRPDVVFKLLRTTLTEYESSALTVEVEVDFRYRNAILYFIVGHAQLRDEEDVTGVRAAALINTFVSRLVSPGVVK
jgi:hypothetical protein